MKNKFKTWLYPLVMGIMLLAVAGSCKKEDDNNVVVKPTEQVPVVATSNVTGVTAKAAICLGNISSDGGATVTERGVRWSTNQTPIVSDNKILNGTGTGNFETSISGLNPNTTYYVRTYATNNAGTAYGTVLSFKTLNENVINEDGDAVE